MPGKVRQELDEVFKTSAIGACGALDPAELRTSSTSSPSGATTPTLLSAREEPASRSIGERRAVLVLRDGTDHVDVVDAAEPRLEGDILRAWRPRDVRALTGHLIPTWRHSYLEVPRAPHRDAECRVR